MSNDPAPRVAAQSGRLDIEGASKSFGEVAALADVSLGVSAGEFVTILGPSGSGKTTLLKVIAGFETADAGRILVDGSDVTDLDPAQRNIGMVFQNYALFPHMSVARNVAYPLAMRRMAKAEIAKRVAEALEMVELAGMAERLPKQLSGGQQQRVALARATVFQPRLLLLDEPFGALDRKLREQMQLEVRRLQRRLGLTTLFITHDQEEALVMSDRIAVMDKGRLQQVGLPHEIYEAPANPFIADFIGESNIFAGVVEAGRRGRGAGPARARAHHRGRRAARSVGAAPASGSASWYGRSASSILPRAARRPPPTGSTDRSRTAPTSACRTNTGSPRRRASTSCVRLPIGPSSRRYRAGEPIAAGFHAADARLIEVQ